jgi:lipopolysaccharide transport system permease protein
VPGLSAVLKPFSWFDRWWEYRDLARNLVAKEITVRYQGAWLGFAWSLMNPLLITLMYLFVFTYVFRSDQTHNALYLVTGILHWTLFSTVIGQAPELLVSNSDLLKKIYFPRLLVPLSNLLVNFVLWLMALLIFVLLFIPLGGQLHWGLLAYPFYLALFLGFNFGIVLTLCVLYVDFRDLKHIVEVVIQLLFWATPIIYPIHLVPARLQVAFMMSPLAEFIEIYHALFWAGRLPSGTLTLAFSAWTAVSLWLGLWLFLRRGARSVERL